MPPPNYNFPKTSLSQAESRQSDKPLGFGLWVAQPASKRHRKITSQHFFITDQLLHT
ncbi:hypothetical protein CHCC20441_3485 [Bacillus licheniformis]|uniref:Uncharacterized protein n=1 Tax=Bacillus licheniformis TaxID=1402 RepID=A0A8B5YB00_BACLI|nr:hypothetical protein CHCC5026_0596 [Bacillus licheniformis]TWN17058.1 hypothetical protein CHCC14564_1623 [Bacillus licheniformis LMG 17339]TWJ46877.1 hypothetical protein CHCC5025_3373 [Bacillus licheniformis]TWJ67207.1 hypothetical protein CHCC5020_2676 [Bacillus licheniformis]TWJ87757.1 hypothetical protein CHCC20496_2382 [Bacillus licheniformis]